MGAGQPEQVGRGGQLQRPEIQHPAGRHDQSHPEDQGQQQPKVEGLPLADRVLQAPRDRRQGNGVIGGKHGLQGHEQGQEQEQLAPLIRSLQQRRQGFDRLRFHGRAAVL